MKITFLGSGTSQGIPVIACSCKVCLSDDLKDKRLRASVLFEIEEKNYVIDAGPDFRQQMLRENVQKLDAILFTHEHKDHIGGLDDVRAFNFKFDKPMDIYGSINVLNALKREYFYVFDGNSHPGLPILKLNEIKNQPFEIEQTSFLPVEVMHHKMSVFGFRIKDFAYITDAKTISHSETEKLKNLDVLVLNALRKEKHISHLNLEEALELIKIIKPKKTYLTHISHLLGIHKEVQLLLPNNVFLAYDQLIIEV
jgi:phosphoribosyl 1,2-cyclic phosphate phosphodiesterase